MRATLYVVTETGARRRLEVRGGHVARFGRSEWADFSFPDDDQLGDVHFVVECRPAGAWVRDLGAGTPTLLNGKPIEEALLRTGDRIQAGRTTWTLEIEGDAADDGAGGGEGDGSQTRPAKSAAEWNQLLSYLGVEGEPLAIPQDDQTWDQVVDALTTAEHFQAAAALRAHQLEPRGAIWWAWQTANESGTGQLAPPQRAALDGVLDWIARPDESRRRSCEATAAALNYQGPGGFLSAAVFFSGDNIAPPDCPSPTPPDPRIAGRLVLSHLLVSAAQSHPAPPADAWRKYLSRAAELTARPIAWPEPRAVAAP